MSRWALAALALVLVTALVARAAAHRAGRRSSRLAAAVSASAGWLGAFAVWSFVGGLARQHGMLAWHDGTTLAVVSAVGAVVQYRVQAERGRPAGVMTFVGGQLAWLALVLALNGALT